MDIVLCVYCKNVYIKEEQYSFKDFELNIGHSPIWGTIDLVVTEMYTHSWHIMELY